MSQSPRIQAKCNAVAPHVFSVPQIFGQSSSCREEISATGDAALKVELSLIAISIPGRSKINFTREGSPHRTAACRGAQPRGCRMFIRAGEIAKILRIFLTMNRVRVAEILVKNILLSVVKIAIHKHST
jgi:hypothetical protein